jgi:DNA-binding MarR family transcriptional regulator
MPSAASSSHFTTHTDRTPLIGALLRMPWELVRGRMLERLHHAGFDDLEPAHLSVLQYPGPEGTRPSELAVRLGISKQALNYLLGQLEGLGYIERVSDLDDLRGKRIHVTDHGNAAIETMRDAIRELEAEWALAIGADRFALLRELLTDLVSQVVEHGG